jgi:nitrite reductase (NO-forming)
MTTATPPPDDDPGAPTPDAPPRLERRAFLRRAGLGGAALVGSGMLAHRAIPHGHDVAAAATGDVVPAPPVHLAGTRVAGESGIENPAALYGHGGEPPMHLPADHLDALTIPPPFRPGGDRVHDHTFVVTEQPVQVGHGVYADTWTYNTTAPGPLLRATEGDRIRVRLVNRTSHAHNLHFHGRHAPGMDGWEPIPPGEEFVYDIAAGPFGLHPYHCHVAPLALHVSRGMYGALIVDPPGGRPPAHEFVLVLSGWDVNGDGRNELMAWNGIAGFFHKFPIKVPVGELVRVYVVNMTEYEPVASFHLHSQTFDVFRSGTSLEPDEHTDTITLGQGERAILEFTLPERGRYMFHPHQHHLADLGAVGWFSAI